MEPPDLDLVRARGWAISFGVHIARATSLAAPVPMPVGMMAISAFGPGERIKEFGVERLAEEVTRTASDLSRAIFARLRAGSLQADGASGS